MDLSNIIENPLFYTSPDSICVIDKSGIIVGCNGSTLRLYGYKREHLIGKPLVNFLTDKSNQTFKTKFPLFKKLLPQKDEIQVKCADGKVVDIWRKGTPFTDEEGNFIGIICFDRDITEKKIKEQQQKKHKEELSNEFKKQTISLENANKKLKDILIKLSTEQEKNKNLLDALPDFIYTINNNGIILDCQIPEKNPMNFKSYDFINKKIIEILQEETAILTLNNVKKTLLSKKPQVFKYSFLFDENTYYQEVRMVYKNETEVLAIIRDITSSVTAEDALKNSEEMLRTIISATKEAIIAIDREGLITTFNPAAEKMFLCEKKDILGKTIDHILPEKYKKDHQKNVNSYFKTGKPDAAIGKIMELPARKSDGTIFPIEISLSSGKLGKKKYVVAVIRDITQRKQVEKLIKNSEESYKSIFNNVTDSIYIQDSKGRFLDVNQGAVDMYGYPKGYFIGNTPEILSAPGKNDNNKVFEHIDKAFNGKPQRFMFWGIRKNGEVFPKDVRISKGKYFGQDVVIVVSSDITDRVNLEVILRDAKEKAEESDRLKTAFLANMSHEIRTPMNSIIGFSELLLGLESENERQKYVSIIKSNGNHLLNIINDIIDISKVEAGLATLTKTDFNINKELDDIKSLFAVRDELRENQIDLRLNKSLSDSKCTISSDKTKFRQILINLIGNALKFTSEGYVEFGYDVVSDNKEKVLQFYVKDSGIGLEDSDKGIIFKRFRQADMSETRAFGGTGLGLAISKAFVELMGGEINVESVINEGSTFYFTVPFEQIKSEIRTDDFQIKPDTSYNWSEKNILIVEDNNANYHLLKIYLEKTDVNILWAKNGKIAVDMCLNDNKIDLVLMDIKLPEMDGYEATRIIKQNCKDIPVIAQTAYAMESDIIKAKEAGCDDFISKPIFQDKLLSMIARLIN